jgi:lia operon protein LiaG
MRLRLRHQTFALAALAASQLGTAGFLAAQAGGAPERVTLTGNQVAIYNLVGSVKLVRGSGRDVVVAVTRGGPDAAQLRVAHGAISGGRQSLRVIYPSNRITFDGLSTRSRTTLRVSEDGTFGHGGDDDDDRSGQRVEISGRSGGLDARADLTVEVPAGKRVEINLAAGSVSATNVESDLYLDVSAATVTTTGTKGVLSLDTGSGEVSVTDQNGNLTIDSGSGSVTFSRIRGDRLLVDAGSGRISGTDVQVQSLDLDLGSGGARVMQLTAKDVRLDTGSGDTELELLVDVSSLDIDSGSGDVSVWIPANLGARVDIDAGSGGIDLDVPVQVTRWERDKLVGTIGDGQGMIRVDSGSGTVRLRRGARR